MTDMYQIAETEGVLVEFVELPSPLKGIYWAPDDMCPIIWLEKNLEKDTALLRCVMAEELGHHFTVNRDCLCNTCFSYGDKMEVSRAEYRAIRWAAQYLVPLDQLTQAIKNGITNKWELAYYFNVTEEMVKLRLGLPDLHGNGIKGD